MHYDKIVVPVNGDAITLNNDHSIVVPNNPIIPYIEGDGIGVDVTPVMLDVANAAVKRAYGGTRNIHWMQVYAGERGAEVYGSDQYLPGATLLGTHGFGAAVIRHMDD